MFTVDGMIDDGVQEYLEPLTPDQGSMFLSEASDGELQVCRIIYFIFCFEHTEGPYQCVTYG